MAERLTRRGVLDMALSLATVLLVAFLIASIALAPAEARLGGLARLVYVHGASVLVGLATFSAAGAMGVVALATRRAFWYRGADAGGQAALLVWSAYTLSAMVVTGLTWGQVIAWSEPRVRVTALIFASAILTEIAIRVVAHRQFLAIVRILMGIAPWIAVQKAEVIRHPVDPIGASGSSRIQTFYLLILLAVAGLSAVLTQWLWAAKEARVKIEQARGIAVAERPSSEAGGPT